MGISQRWSRSGAVPADVRERLAGVADVCRRHGVRLCYVFGSVASERPGRPPGDVDLAALPGPRTDFWALRLDLAALLGTERLDLVDLSRASEVTRFEIIRTARLLYAVDVETENAFELRTLAEYKDRAVPRRRRAEWLRESLRR